MNTVKIETGSLLLQMVLRSLPGFVIMMMYTVTSNRQKEPD